MIENQLQRKIKQFQFDDRGEFISKPFLTHLVGSDIQQLVLCPNTPQETG